LIAKFRSFAAALIKKENKFFLIYKEIQKKAVAKEGLLNICGKSENI
jgi:hypothetical protein